MFNRLYCMCSSLRRSRCSDSICLKLRRFVHVICINLGCDYYNDYPQFLSFTQSVPHLDTKVLLCTILVTNLRVLEWIYKVSFFELVRKIYSYSYSKGPLLVVGSRTIVSQCRNLLEWIPCFLSQFNKTGLRVEQTKWLKWTSFLASPRLASNVSCSTIHSSILPLSCIDHTYQ